MTSLIYQRITDAMQEIDSIKKTQINKEQRFKFRGIDDLYNNLHPILAKHKIFFTIDEILNFQSETKEFKSYGSTHVRTGIIRLYILKYKIYTDDGSSIFFTVPAEAIDFGDKATGKALSIGHKSLFIQLFAIPTEDIVDPDSSSYEVETTQLKQNHKIVGSNATLTIGHKAIKNTATSSCPNDSIVVPKINETNYLFLQNKLQSSKSLDELKSNYQYVIKQCLKVKDRDAENKLTIIKDECKLKFIEQQKSKESI